MDRHQTPHPDLDITLLLSLITYKDNSNYIFVSQFNINFFSSLN